MNHALPPGLLDATRLTHAGRLTEATAALQRMLAGRTAPDTPAPAGPPTIDGVADTVGEAFVPDAKPVPSGPEWKARVPGALRGVLGGVDLSAFQTPGGNTAHCAPAVPEGAQFLSATFNNPAGTRPYKLYVPSGYSGQPVPLIVMLHGCTQSPDDFAAGTRMNEAAERHPCLVAYPGQTSAANQQKCWKWFSAGDQQRDVGEPSLIAGITRQVMREYAVDPRRVYVAGLSAGGAAAAVMGSTYPDLYAAIGVHSGLACGAARDMPSAFAAMQGGGGASRFPQAVPAIIFHGDRDTTVNPRNADAVVAQAAQGRASKTGTEAGKVPGGHAFDCTRYAGADGQVVEQWTVHGGGHAWFGGSPAGSYTDPRGPDATAEMLRFFLEHPRPMSA